MHPWRRMATRLRVAEALRQRQEIQTIHGPLYFVMGDARATHYVRDLLVREPETLQWIDQFEPGSIFWDVGAHIGIYSLYAALRPDIAVRAFEPAAANYGALCRNIEANAFPQVEAYCVALGDRTRLGHLNMSATHAGSEFNAFERDASRPGRSADIVFRQPAIGYSMDQFRLQFELPAPNYLKIDVDSTEEEILVGAAQTLRHPALRSLLVEFDHPETARGRRIVEFLAAAGLMPQRRGAPDGGSINVIFAKDENLATTARQAS